MAFGSPISRRLLLTMIALVAVIHGAFIGGFYLLDIPHRAPRERLAYTALWTALTLAVVLVYLRRIRVIRDEARGRRRRAAR